jgi:1-acyl-sn-glycerol-3-phosphate acyltransferase
MRLFFTVLLWMALALNTVVLFPVVVFAFLLDRRSGALAHLGIRRWARNNLYGGLFQWNVVCDPSLDKNRSYVIVSNHVSFFDICVLVALLPLQFKFVSRKEFFRMPVWGWSMYLARYVKMDRGKPLAAAKSVLKSAEWLDKGFSILMFPEGTRSPDGKMRPFKDGAFKIALKAGKPILPVTLVGTDNAIPKGTLNIIPCRFTLSIDKPVETEGLTAEDLPRLTEEIRNRMIESYEKHLPSTGVRFPGTKRRVKEPEKSSA